MRIGSGYDVHKLAEGRDCIIGGVKIPYEKVYWDIPMRMYCCMPLRMRFWGRLPWAISAGIFLITTHSIKAQTAENYYPTFWG